jgi:hypothetical protein
MDKSKTIERETNTKFHTNLFSGIGYNWSNPTD